MTKTIEQQERQKNVLLSGDHNLSAKVTEEQFADLMAEHGYTGVDFDGREQFLKDNGYDVTRENMVDGSLSARQDN